MGTAIRFFFFVLSSREELISTQHIYTPDRCCHPQRTLYILVSEGQILSVFLYAWIISLIELVINITLQASDNNTFHLSCSFFSEYFLCNIFSIFTLS